MIAREDNSEDFISDENWDGFIATARKHGNVVYGRKTYEIVQTWEKKYLESLKGVKKIIVSREGKMKLGGDCIHAISPGDALQKLESEGFETALVAGGSTLNAAFAKRELLDEIILNMNSVVIGKGIPVFASDTFDLQLELLDTKKITDNILQLRYKVVK